MLRKAKYTNHLGVTVSFNEAGSPYTLNPFNLRSYNAAANVMSDRITGFSYGSVKNIGINIGVVGGSAEETATNYDYLASLFESDVLAVLPGTLEINGYSIKCYISGLTPQSSFKRGKEAIAAVITDNLLWYKELFTVKYTPDNQIILDSELENLNKLTYPHDFPYAFATDITVKKIDNPALHPAHFRLIIEGPAMSPTITIGGHIYSVDVSVSEGSRLIIDSRASTITLTDANGISVNVFDKRNRESDVFEKIPTGTSRVQFGQAIEKFYLTLIDERSYPQWST